MGPPPPPPSFLKNEDNKNQIVECGALPTLIFMLRSTDAAIAHEAVGVLGNLVHSSAHIKKRVLEEGALQPVIQLLTAGCGGRCRHAKVGGGKGKGGGGGGGS